MARRDQFYEELIQIFDEATKEGRENVDVNAGDLHRRVGEYPSPDHRMPVCCSVMRSEFSADCDVVLESPPKGDGASLMIRYNLPRKGEFGSRHGGSDMAAARAVEIVEEQHREAELSYEAVIRQMMTREDELINQRMLWMAAFNGLLFAALSFAWDKPAARFLGQTFSFLGFSACFLSGIGLILASTSQRRLLLLWHRKKPKDYVGPGVMGAEPLDNKLLYSMYASPWIWLVFVFAGGWLVILRFVCKYVK